MANSGSTYFERYLARTTIPKLGWYSSCLWVRVDDAKGNLLFHSKKIKVKPGEFLSPLEDGIGFYGQNGREQERQRIKTLGVNTMPANDTQEELGIEYPSKNPSASALCDVVDHKQDKQIGSLHNGIAAEDLVDTIISGDLMLGDTWYVYDPAGNNIATFKASSKLLGPLYDYSVYAHNSRIGRAYLSGKNPFRNRPIVIELESDSASQLDPRMLFSFATLVFAFHAMKVRHGFGPGGG